MSGQVDVHKDRANYKRPTGRYKVLIAGEFRVGKTSLFKRMLKLGFNDDSRESRGIHEEIFDDDETIIPVRLKSIITILISNLYKIARVLGRVQFGEL